MTGSLPTTAATGQRALLTIKAISQTNANLTDSVTDQVTVVDDAVIQVNKSQSISSGVGAQDITYTFTYNNTGTAAARVVINDTLPQSLQYIAGSGLWSNGNGALTDADDTETGANIGVKYKVNGQQVTTEAASVAPLSTGNISFKVKVASTDTNEISNTATYQQLNAQGTTVKNTQTNTVIYKPIASYGVVANNLAKSALNDGNPNQAPYNLTTKPNLPAEQEVLFDNYIWNTGSASDTFNLSYQANNLPSCATVKFYGSDGKTVLVDTNNDGIIDTGPIAQGAARLVRVGVYALPECATTASTVLDITTTSVTDRRAFDAVRNQINQINQITVIGQSDLYNTDGSGKGVGNVDSNNNALITKNLDNKGKAVFPLTVNNTGNSANTYQLFVADSAVDLQKPATN